MSTGWFRVIFWQSRAVPDASLLKTTTYKTYDDAKDYADRMMSTNYGKLDYPYGYTIVVELHDNPGPRGMI